MKRVVLLMRVFFPVLALFAFTVLSEVQGGQGPEFFVSEEGNDSAEGTSVDQPLRSITQGIRRAREALQRRPSP